MQKQLGMTFAQVYSEYKHKIYSYIYYRVNQNQDVAEDIVSDVFVKAYQKFDTYDDAFAMSTWLYAIARNTLIDHYRKGKEVVDIEGLNIADETDPLFLLLDSNISLTEVEVAIASLPTVQRECITRQFFKGETSAHIATDIGQSHSSVRQHVSRGIGALRRQLLVLVCTVVSSLVLIPIV